MNVLGSKDSGLAWGLPLRYVRDLRPLTAIALDAISASLHTPLRGTPTLRSSSVICTLGEVGEAVSGECSCNMSIKKDYRKMFHVEHRR